jgi:hypothetical protein
MDNLSDNIFQELAKFGIRFYKTPFENLGCSGQKFAFLFSLFLKRSYVLDKFLNLVTIEGHRRGSTDRL